MREKLYNLCSIVFTISLFIFLLMGFIIVFTQILGIFIKNPDLVISINKLLKIHATHISAIAGFSGFFAYYLKRR